MSLADQNGTLFMDGPFAISLKEKKLLIFRTNLSQKVPSGMDAAATFHFLLRRADAKPHLSDFLVQAIQDRTDPAVVASLLEKLAANYAQSVAERGALAMKSRILFPATCLNNGEHFLNEAEIEELFCKRLVHLAASDRPDGGAYYTNLLSILFLELAAAECPLNAITHQFVRWLLRTGGIGHLQQLFLNGFLPEKVSLAVVFCELGSTKRVFHTLNLPDIDREESLISEASPEGRRDCLQLGLEFLRRLKHLLSRPDYARILGAYMTENHRIAELISLVQSGEVDLELLDVKKLLLSSKSKNSSHPFHATMAFLNQHPGFRLHAHLSTADLDRIIKL